MIFETKTVHLKTGEEAIFRAPQEADAPEVLAYLKKACGETEYLAADLVGAGPGDRVILAFGAAARAGRPDVPVDAAIVAILDETEATHG